MQEEKESAIKQKIVEKEIIAESESQSGGQNSSEANEGDALSKDSGARSEITDNEAIIPDEVCEPGQGNIIDVDQDEDEEMTDGGEEEKEGNTGVRSNDDEIEVVETEEAVQTQGRKKASFAEATKGVSQQQLLGAKIKYQHTSRFEISVYIPDLPENPTDDQQAAAVKEIMKSLLKRFKHLTKRVAIVPWSNVHYYWRSKGKTKSRKI